MHLLTRPAGSGATLSPTPPRMREPVHGPRTALQKALQSFSSSHILAAMLLPLLLFPAERVSFAAVLGFLYTAGAVLVRGSMVSVCGCRLATTTGMHWLGALGPRHSLAVGMVRQDTASAEAWCLTLSLCGVGIQLIGTVCSQPPSWALQPRATHQQPAYNHYTRPNNADPFWDICITRDRCVAVCCASAGCR
jgi:hypothetical protein